LYRSIPNDHDTNAVIVINFGDGLTLGLTLGLDLDADPILRTNKSPPPATFLLVDSGLLRIWVVSVSDLFEMTMCGRFSVVGAIELRTRGEDDITIPSQSHLNISLIVL
jgi:hypothetical protein